MKPVCRLTDRLPDPPRVIWGGSHKSREALVTVFHYFQYGIPYLYCTTVHSCFRLGWGISLLYNMMMGYIIIIALLRWVSAAAHVWGGVQRWGMQGGGLQGGRLVCLAPHRAPAHRSSCWCERVSLLQSLTLISAVGLGRHLWVVHVMLGVLIWSSSSSPCSDWRWCTVLAAGSGCAQEAEPNKPYERQAT